MRVVQGGVVYRRISCWGGNCRREMMFGRYQPWCRGAVVPWCRRRGLIIAVPPLCRFMADLFTSVSHNFPTFLSSVSNKTPTDQTIWLVVCVNWSQLTVVENIRQENQVSRENCSIIQVGLHPIGSRKTIHELTPQKWALILSFISFTPVVFRNVIFLPSFPLIVTAD